MTSITATELTTTTTTSFYNNIYRFVYELLVPNLELRFFKNKFPLVLRISKCK